MGVRTMFDQFHENAELPLSFFVVFCLFTSISNTVWGKVYMWVGGEFVQFVDYVNHFKHSTMGE